MLYFKSSKVYVHFLGKIFFVKMHIEFLTTLRTIRWISVCDVTDLTVILKLCFLKLILLNKP